MAEPLSPGPTAVDPELETQLIRLLSIRGTLGSLKVLDTIVPVVSMGDVVTPSISVIQPNFRSTDVFSAGVQITPPANTVLADTAALAAGIYDVIVEMNTSDTGTGGDFLLQHRNAANAATLMTAGYTHNAGLGNAFRLVFGYELALNERLRVLNEIAGVAPHRYSAVIWARRRT